MGHIVDVVQVGDVKCNLISLFDSELLKAEHRRGRGHVDPHLVAVADGLFGTFFQIYTIGCRLLARLFPHRVIAIPDVDRVHFRPMNKDRVMRLSKGRAVMDHLHLVARDVDQLLVFRP